MPTPEQLDAATSVTDRPRYEILLVPTAVAGSPAQAWQFASQAGRRLAADAASRWWSIDSKARRLARTVRTTVLDDDLHVLVDDRTGIELAVTSVARLSVPFWDEDEDPTAAMTALLGLARVVASELGMVGFDPQLRSLVTDERTVAELVPAYRTTRRRVLGLGAERDAAEAETQPQARMGHSPIRFIGWSLDARRRRKAAHRKG